VRSARIYKLAKDSAVKARTQAINQLKAVLVIADPALRERLSTLGNAELFRTCATLSPPDGGGDEDAVAQATHMTLRMLAERIEQLTGQINELNQRLTRLVEHHAPQLLEPVGIGPDSAVTLLITMGDNPERLNTEASFAALCGVSPIEYSSGRRSTRRLNGGRTGLSCASGSCPFRPGRTDLRSERPGPGHTGRDRDCPWPHIGKGPATPLPHSYRDQENPSMPRLSLTTERLALFGTLLATFGELHPLCDHWVSAAKAVSTSVSVSLLQGS
jgi:hypothetical protein